MKKTIISMIAVFVVSMLLGFVIHATLLHDDYSKLTNIMRSDAEQEDYFVFMLAAHVLMSVGYSLIYLRGREDKPWIGQGIRFGLLVSMAAVVPIYLIYHAVAKFPLDLTMKQIGFDTIGMVVVGLVLAFINR